MPSVAENVPSEAQPKQIPSYKDVITTKLGQIYNNLSFLSCLYYSNMAFVLLSVIFNYQTISVLIIDAHLCMAAIAGLIRILAPPDRVDNRLSHTYERELREEVAAIHTMLNPAMKQAGQIEERQQQLSRELEAHKKALVVKQMGYTMTCWDEVKITPAEKDELGEILHSAYNSLERPASNAAERLIFGMIEWAAGCSGSDTWQIVLKEDAICLEVEEAA